MPYHTAVDAKHQIWPNLPTGNPAYLSMRKVAHCYPLVQTSTSNSVKAPFFSMKDVKIKVHQSDHVAHNQTINFGGSSTASSQQDIRRRRKQIGGVSYEASSIKKLLQGYTPFPLKDEIALFEKDECSKCKIYHGQVAVKPCGHGKFCYSCINTLRSKAIKHQRPGRCLSRNCISIVKSWFVLVNINSKSSH